MDNNIPNIPMKPNMPFAMINGKNTTSPIDTSSSTNPYPRQHNPTMKKIEEKIMALFIPLFHQKAIIL